MVTAPQRLLAVAFSSNGFCRLSPNSFFFLFQKSHAYTSTISWSCSRTVIPLKVHVNCLIILCPRSRDLIVLLWNDYSFKHSWQLPHNFSCPVWCSWACNRTSIFLMFVSWSIVYIVLTASSFKSYPWRLRISELCLNASRVFAHRHIHW